jgi:hypothetical protein
MTRSKPETDKRKFYITDQQRGNRWAYIIRDDKLGGIEVAWTTSLRDAQWAISEKLNGTDITDYSEKYHA